LALCLLSAAVSGARAGDLGNFSFLLENDLWFGRTDRWYTNGVRLSWGASGAPEFRSAELLSDAGKSLLWGNAAPTMSYGVGQTMYTPADIKSSTPQPNDRPWGGYLYFAAAAHEFYGNAYRRNELKLGVTGPFSYTDRTQKAVHKLIGSPKPEGWDNQLKQRLGVQLNHSGVYRFGDDPSGLDLFGFQYGYGASVGSLRVNANTNFGIVFGKLDDKNSPMVMGNEGDYVSPDFADRKQFRLPFAYAMVGLNGVAYNYFIQGPTPYGKSDLSLRPFYGSAQVGVSVPLGEFSDTRVRLVLMANAKQAEFTRRIDGKRGEASRYGGFELNFDSKN
jgi:lipid A 3-O-deacylase